MKIASRFFGAALVAALLTGCGSSSPSNKDIEKAIRSYVGLARPDIGDVKLDELKILKEYIKTVGTDDVYFRQFEAHYTVTYKSNPSKHTFEGTIALHRQGHDWVMSNGLCTLTYAYSPPIVDAATQAMKDTNAGEEQRNREQAAKGQTNQK